VIFSENRYPLFRIMLDDTIDRTGRVRKFRPAPSV
jgi:hypothetical protein